MSTRTAKLGTPPRQEKFASSAKHRRGLLGNLVAKRATHVRTRAGREVIYFLADVSMRETRARHITCSLFPAWPWPSTSEREEAAFERVARELHEFYPVWCEARALKRLPKFLAQLALDPSIDVETASVPGCRDLCGLLTEYKARFEISAVAHVAHTDTVKQVWETLDYALSQRGLVVATGEARTGKSTAAQSFALSHLGQCRYVQLTSAMDHTSFFRDLARGLGVACTAQRKCQEMRARVEDALREQHVMLILDEADYLWPQTTRPTEAPLRANWLLSSLCNSGVAVALIGTKNFPKLLGNLERKLPIWNARTWHGRVRLNRALPDQSTREDLEAIISASVPEADEAMRLLLLGHALKSPIAVTAIEGAAARARWFAAAESRSMGFADIERAMIESGTLPTPPPRREPAATAPPFSREARLRL